MIYKRGKVYWYKFMWQGRLVRESTKQGNDKVARQIESAHRTALAKAETLAALEVAPGYSPAQKLLLELTDNEGKPIP